MRFHTVIVALAALVALAACNTIGGAGQDIQSGGRAITDTAEEVQDDLSD